jgi:hypothetical protein
VEVRLEGGTLQAVGSEAKEGARCRVRFLDDTIRPGAEATGRKMEEAVPVSPKIGIDAPDAVGQRIDAIVDPGEWPLKEQAARRCRTPLNFGRTEMTVKCFQLFKKVIERRGKRSHTWALPRAVSG